MNIRPFHSIIMLHRNTAFQATICIYDYGGGARGCTPWNPVGRPILPPALAAVAGGLPKDVPLLPPSGLSPRIASLYFIKYVFKGSTYLSKPRVLMAHNKSSPLIVFRFSCIHLSDASDVMNEMNSETHSCTVSLESFAIFALSGRVFFMIRAMFAIGKYRSLEHYK